MTSDLLKRKKRLDFKLTPSCYLQVTIVQWGLEIRTPQTERRSKTEPFFDRFAKFGLFFEPNAKHEPTVRKPTKLGRFTNKK